MNRFLFGQVAVLSIVVAMLSPALTIAQDAPAADITVKPLPAGAIAFVPATLSAGAGSLELRDQATIYGPDIKLKQLCRWSDAQAAAFTPVADLVVARIDHGASSRVVSLNDIRSMLHDAGVNVAVIDFTGATQCVVRRSDPSSGDPVAVQQWIDQHKSSKPAAAVPIDHLTGAQLASAVEKPQPAYSPPQSFKTLRQRLAIDLSQRLNLPIDNLQIQYDPKDTSLLNLSEPSFHFDIQANHISDLGKVSWRINLQAPGGQQNVDLSAVARAWETQLVTARPLAFRSVLRPQDFTQRRILIDTIPYHLPLTPKQVIGQEAACDLAPGVVLTGQMVDAVPLAKAGQYVTVTLNEGGVRVTTVAKALEAGSYGQTIQVRNDDTRNTFDVTLTGPQAAQMGPLAAVASPRAELASILNPAN